MRTRGRSAAASERGYRRSRARSGRAICGLAVDSTLLLAFALGLLGLGWNFGLVGGTALVTDAVPLGQRARTQGNVDLAVALSGATGGMTSGVVVAATSFAALSLTGGLLALVLLPLLLAEHQTGTRVTTARERLTAEQSAAA